MSIAFINRQPTQNELDRWKLIMSTFNDGSGQERDKSGGTRLGWRDIERVVSVMLGGNGGEDKQLFDVVIQEHADPNKYYGVSVKSKELSRRSALEDLETNGRVYMELCNSPAKLWGPLKEKGINESDFSSRKHAKIIGEEVLKTVRSWETSFAEEFESSNPGKKFLLSDSIYLTISYNKSTSSDNRFYQIHSFDLEFPKDIIWEYSSAKCLRGYDPKNPSEAIFDWYGLSGGQLKYYPIARTAKYNSGVFKLINTRVMSLEEKAGRYFPDEWLKSGGRKTLSPDLVSNELFNLAKLFDKSEAAIINKAASDLISRNNKI